MRTLKIRKFRKGEREPDWSQNEINFLLHNYKKKNMKMLEKLFAINTRLSDTFFSRTPGAIMARLRILKKSGYNLNKNRIYFLGQVKRWNKKEQHLKKIQSKSWRIKHPKYQKQWKEEHPEYYKKWWKKHPEYQKQWANKHSEDLSKYKKKWHKLHPEYSKQYYIKWKKEHPEYYKKIFKN